MRPGSPPPRLVCAFAMKAPYGLLCSVLIAFSSLTTASVVSDDLAFRLMPTGSEYETGSSVQATNESASVATARVRWVMPGVVRGRSGTVAGTGVRPAWAAPRSSVKGGFRDH